MAFLVLLQAGEATPYELTDENTVLGRHPDCTIQLQSNMVSRKHAQVVRDGNSHYLEDLGSGNGTFLNGKMIEGRMLLEPQDRIKLGPMLLRFEPGPPGLSGKSHTPLSTTLFGESAFPLDITSGANDSATIMESSENASGYGVLEVQPEAKLRGVLEITRSLAGTVDLQKLLPKILDTLFNIFPQADRGSILLKNEESGQMVPAAQRHRRESQDDSVKLSRTILNKVLQEKAGILSADAANDSRFETSESISSLTIRSMMCVPMLNLDGEPMGIINLDTQNPVNQFRKDDLDLLVAVAGQAALSYENARLLTSHMEKLKQDSEMDVARNVQQALLPVKLPEPKGYEFYASYDAAQAVGGDYYDALLVGDDRLCISFGDVAGKGVPAALVMSRLSSVVQNTLRFVDDVREAAGTINNHMCAKAVEGRFVTYVLVILDLQTHEMQLVVAGHMSPLIRKTDGTIEEFDEDSIGVPIGVIEDFPFDVISRTIEPGETMLIYTDGVSEAMDPDGKLYSEQRVREILQSSKGGASALGKVLLDDVRRHANGRPQNDDITIMALSRNA